MEIPRREGPLNRLVGHFWTIAPALYGATGLKKAPPSRFWREWIPNEFGEPILHTGAFSDGRDDRTLVVVLHGLGGSVDRSYCVRAASAAHRAGFPCLRIALRGADGQGGDIHHAGFVDDLAEIFRRAPCAEFERIALVGYSLGGHVALTAAVDQIDDRLASVVAICSPLDLRACQQAIDGPRAWLYRRYLLEALKETYPVASSRLEDPAPPERIDEAATLREWDALTVVPRFGFRDVDHYYESQSVGPRLGGLRIPGLFVASPGDPIVPAASLRAPLAEASDRLEVRWVKNGGHVFFPPDVNIGFGSRPGLEHQVMNWLRG